MVPVVTIGGGSGQYVLLSGLRDLADLDITSVVSMVDSGGSTGRLRDELGVLPPGDILKCILALSPDREIMRGLLLKRFQRNERLRGHNAGNMLLSFLSSYTGVFAEGVGALAEIMGTRGTVLPVTTDRATLVAELNNGQHVFGEAAIDVGRKEKDEKIARSYLVPHHGHKVSVYPPVIDAINNAHYIVIGPGDLYTSIIPNLLVPGVAGALCKTPAKLIYVLNIMTKYGETNGFYADDFITILEKHVGRKVDVVVANNRCPSENILKTYDDEQAAVVRVPDPENIHPRILLQGDFLDEAAGLLRHHSDHLAQILYTKAFVSYE